VDRAVLRHALAALLLATRILAAPAAQADDGIEEVHVQGKKPAPQPEAASDSSTQQDELSLVPRHRAEDVLEVVPGLFSVQHSGGGKAQQYFMRGFDLDHGTDLAFSVDGVPVNAVSHGHGQGYSDLHFLIPETIETVDSTKGPYAASAGDFATAGSVTFRMADHFAESLGKVELGPDGHERVVALESPDLGKGWRMVVAAEQFRENGPFVHPEDFGRLNAYAKVTHDLDDRSQASLTLMAYSGSWNASGVLPARAVCGEGDGTPRPVAYQGANCINRWDSLDPSQGGAAHRVMAWAGYTHRFDHGWDLDARLFVVQSSLHLFPNDGIAAPFQPDGIQHGSQVEQDDARTESGASVRLTRRERWLGMVFDSTFGAQIRDDAVDAELHRTQDRKRLDGVDALLPGPEVDSGIQETEIGAYFEEDVRVARWLRFVIAAREDRVDAGVTNRIQAPTTPQCLALGSCDHASGVLGAGQLSPKARAILSPSRWLDLFVEAGRGFHTNDARTIVGGSGAPIALIAPATGGEVGATVRPLEGLTLSAVGYVLDIASELTYDGDTASTQPSGPTRRYGVELTGRYHFLRNLFADASFSASHARYTDEADVRAGTDWVTLAPRRFFSAGVGVRQPIGDFTLVGSARVRSMADRPATQNWSPAGGVGLTATGFTVVDAEAGLRWKALEVGVDVLNVGDVAWREGQFAVSSRLPLEGTSPPEGISFTPGLPRTALVHGAVSW
jgi:outer membrane receptor protein involved in Fe transport